MPLSEQFSFKKLSLNETLLDVGVRFILNCPPEDVSTAERLFFQIEEAHWFYEDFARVQNPALPTTKFKTFVGLLYAAVPVLTTLCQDPVDALLKFQTYKLRIPVRGAIMLNEKMDKAVMVRSWKGHSWGFPRGKINKDESDVACAIREVLEETGFDMSAYINSDDYVERTISGRTMRLYIVPGIPESTVFETQTRKEISKISWIKVSQLPLFDKNPKPQFNFYMTTPFMNGLKAFLSRRKGYATKLSGTESNALKSMLGISSKAQAAPDQVEIKNDEASAQQLLSILKGTAPPVQQLEQQQREQQPAGAKKGDRELLLNLLKEGTPELPDQDNATAEMESAKQILALLDNEIATENVILGPASLESRSTKAAEDAEPLKDAAAPPLPPNWMLESLVSSRRSHPRPKRSSISSDRPSFAQGDNVLLKVLNGRRHSDSNKLMALLKPTDSDASGSTSSPVAEGSMLAHKKNKLIDLLGNSEAVEESKADEENEKKAPTQDLSASLDRNAQKRKGKTSSKDALLSTGSSLSEAGHGRSAGYSASASGARPRPEIKRLSLMHLLEAASHEKPVTKHNHTDNEALSSDSATSLNSESEQFTSDETLTNVSSPEVLSVKEAPKLSLLHLLEPESEEVSSNRVTPKTKNALDNIAASTAVKRTPKSSNSLEDGQVQPRLKSEPKAARRDVGAEGRKKPKDLKPKDEKRDEALLDLAKPRNNNVDAAMVKGPKAKAPRTRAKAAPSVTVEEQEIGNSGRAPSKHVPRNTEEQVALDTATREKDAATGSKAGVPKKISLLHLLDSEDVQSTPSNLQEQAPPEQITPKEATPEQTAPEQTAPEQTAPEQTTPEKKLAHITNEKNDFEVPIEKALLDDQTGAASPNSSQANTGTSKSHINEIRASADMSVPSRIPTEKRKNRLAGLLADDDQADTNIPNSGTSDAGNSVNQTESSPAKKGAVNSLLSLLL